MSKNKLPDSTVPVIPNTGNGRSESLSAIRTGKISTKIKISMNQMLVYLDTPNTIPATAPSVTRCQRSFDLISSILLVIVIWSGIK